MLEQLFLLKELKSDTLQFYLELGAYLTDTEGFGPIGKLENALVFRTYRERPNAKGMLETICDPQGKFVFSDVPAGAYYAITSVSWDVPGSSWPRGGTLMKKVAVSPDKTASVVLTAIWFDRDR
jgi:hypothetical protein